MKLEGWCTSARRRRPSVCRADNGKKIIAKIMMVQFAVEYQIWMHVKDGLQRYFDVRTRSNPAAGAGPYAIGRRDCTNSIEFRLREEAIGQLAAIFAGQHRPYEGHWCSPGSPLTAKSFSRVRLKFSHVYSWHLDIGCGGARSSARDRGCDIDDRAEGTTRDAFRKTGRHSERDNGTPVSRRVSHPKSVKKSGFAPARAEAASTWLPHLK